MNINLGMKQVFNVLGYNDTAFLYEFLVEYLCCQMEDVSEGAIVDGVFIFIVGFYDTAHVIVEELQLAAHISVDG